MILQKLTLQDKIDLENKCCDIDKLEELTIPTLNDYMLISQNGTTYKIKTETLLSLFGGYAPITGDVILTENSDYLITEDGVYIQF